MFTRSQSPLGPLAQKSLLGRHRATAAEPVVSNVHAAKPEAVDSTPTANVISCEHGIFTSMRSATGEGYRLIATSPGMTVEEKQELTRCFPSHGSLVLGPGITHGLLAYPLSSGRHCIACCCHAGLEQSARGGQRVYTHFVLMDTTFVERMQANPLPVHRFLSNLIQHGGPQLRPPAFLEPLVMPVTSGAKELWLRQTHLGTAFPVKTGPSERLWVGPVLAEMLGGRSVLLAGAFNLWTLLSRLLVGMPRDLRARLSVSVGLRYAPARRSHLILVPALDPSANGFAAEGLQTWSGSQSAPAVDPAIEPWCRLVHRWCEEGAADEVAKLTDGLLASASPALLAKVAGLCEDLYRLEHDPNCNKDELRRSYEKLNPATEQEAELLARLRSLTEPTDASPSV